MVLTTHAVTGAAVASFFPSHPILAFVLAFASHFAMDSIPHWSYAILSETMNPNGKDEFKIDKRFIYDIIRVGTDALLGIFLAMVLFSTNNSLTPKNNFDLIILGGAFFGILPDALQFAYSKWHHEPLISLQKFHMWIHSKKDIKGALWGVTSQIILIVIVFTTTTFVHALIK